MPRANEVARTAAFLGAARALAGVVTMALAPLIVRRLTQAEFGVYKQLDLVAGLLLPFLGLGLDKGLAYFIPRDRARTPERVSAALLPIGVLGLLAALIVWLFPGEASGMLGSEPLRLLLVAAVTGGLSSVFLLSSVRILIATGRGGLASIISGVRGLLVVVVVGLVVLVDPRLNSILCAYLALALVQIVFVLVLLLRCGHLTRRFGRDALREQFAFGSRLWGAGIVQMWAGRLDRYLVSLTQGAAAYAIYTVGRTTIPFYSTMETSVEASMAPTMARWEGMGEHERMAHLWRASIRRLLPVACLTFAGLQATAHWLIPFVFTDAYAAATPIVRVSAVTVLLAGYSGTEGVLRAFARVNFLFAINAVSGVARLGLCILVLQTGSLVALAAVAVGLDALVRLSQAVVAARCLSLGAKDLVPLDALRFPAILALAGIGASILVAGQIEVGLMRFAIVAGIWGTCLLIQVYRSGMLQSIGLMKSSR